MIKRDYLELVAAAPESDGEGGNTHEYVRAELIPAHVSTSSSLVDVTQYGIKDEMMLHTVTNKPLVNGASVRYRYKSRLYKLLRQTRTGNEWFQVLKEVYN